MTSAAALPDLARAALRTRGLHAEAVEGGLRLGLGGREVHLSLDALARVLALAPPGDQAARLVAWAAAVAGALAPGPAEGALVPRLLPAADPRLWTRALGPGLHLALALDAPTHQRLLSPFDLPRRGLSQEGAVAQAMATLRARRGAPLPLPGVHAWAWALGDGLDAARALLLSEGAGACVVLPARDLCWWVPGDQPGAEGTARALAAEARALGDLPYPLSPRAWRVHAAGWTPL